MILFLYRTCLQNKMKTHTKGEISENRAISIEEQEI